VTYDGDQSWAVVNPVTNLQMSYRRGMCWRGEQPHSSQEKPLRGVILYKAELTCILWMYGRKPFIFAFGMSHLFCAPVRWAEECWLRCGAERVLETWDVRRVRRIAKNYYYLRHVRLFIRPHRTTRLPLDGFWYLSKSWSFIIIRQE
jgi:hypothetical protein